ncbi:MAG TPA: tetratricopeptide repeat protein [Planctomycetota bacterium]|nr:tetratricopeptide repeat protein [Planctomycetota bacterium]
MPSVSQRVPPSLQRRANEVEGWLELRCPHIALEKVEPLLRVPGARPVALYLRVRALVDAGRCAEALRDIDELRTMHHEPEWLDLTEAWCCKRVGRIADAVACMERLVRRDPKSAIGYFNLGCYLALLGHHDMAMRALRRACALDSAFRGVPLDDPDLDSVRDRRDFAELRHCAPTR